MKGLRRNQLHLNVVFILLSYCWGGRWLGQTHAKILQDETFGNSDDRIGNISVSHRLSLPHVIVDECTDFYGHVCRGHSILHNSFLEVLDQESWRNRLHTRLEALISAEVWPDDEPAVKKVKRQYELCMDFDKRDQFASDSLRLLLGNTSSFPMIMGSSQWDPQTLQILEPQKYDSSLFSIRVRDGKILIDRYDVSAYGRFLSNLKNVSTICNPDMYKSKIRQVFRRMGLIDQNTEHSFDKALDAVMDFRLDLHELAKMNKMVHTRMTVGELQQHVSIDQTNWPQLNWESFLRNVFINATRVKINSKTEVDVEMGYLMALRTLMMRHGPHCIANHIKLHLLETYASETSRGMLLISKDLALAAHDTIGLHFRKFSLNSCINKPHILRVLNYMYLQKWFPNESRDAARDMVRRLKDSLEHYLASTFMMTKDVLQSATDRLTLLSVIVGSRKKYSDYNLLDPLYRYEVSDNHLTSVMNARRYFKEYEYSELGKCESTILRGITILEDTPHVSVEKGIINLPIGYLQRMSLSPIPSGQLSYATLGYKISRFMNEVIIKQGFRSREFSKDSPWYAGNWRKFLEKITCIEDQYHMQSLNKSSTTDEEFKETYDGMLERYVYDNAAFQTLYVTFNSGLYDGGIPITLSTKYTDQEFIAHWTNMHCLYDEEDEKPPSVFRVNNVLRNSPIFHFTFDCSDGSPMNPRKKCVFWD